MKFFLLARMKRGRKRTIELRVPVRTCDKGACECECKYVAIHKQKQKKRRTIDV